MEGLLFIPECAAETEGSSKTTNAIIARMMMKKKLLSIPQEGPAARSMNNRSEARTRCYGKDLQR